MSELFSLDENDLVVRLIEPKSARVRTAVLVAILAHLLILLATLKFEFGPPAWNFVLKQPTVRTQLPNIHLVYYSEGGSGVGGGGGGGGREEQREATKAQVSGLEVSRAPVKRTEREPPPVEPPPTIETPENEKPIVETPVTLPSGGEDTPGVIIEEAPAASETGASAGPGRGGGIGDGVGPGIGSGTGSGVGPGSGGGSGGGPYRPGGGVSMPKLIHEEKVVFPDEARRHFTTGVVILEAVVRRDGSVGNIKVIRPLPHGCVEAGIAALKKWRFLPGRKDGVPVDVYFLVTFTFS